MRQTEKHAHAAQLTTTNSKKCRYNFWSYFFPCSPLSQRVIRYFVSIRYDYYYLILGLIAGAAGLDDGGQLGGVVRRMGCGAQVAGQERPAAAARHAGVRTGACAHSHAHRARSTHAG